MSIKIYKGRIIPAPIGRVYSMLMEAKPQAKEIGKALQDAWMTDRAVQLIDKASLEGGEVENPLLDAWSELLDKIKEIKNTGQRNPSVDFEFELWIFPLKTKTLVLPHTEQIQMVEWFDTLPFVQDYAYWDNSDKNDDIDEKEWQRRERDWHAVMPIGETPSERCLTFQMFNHELPMPPDKKAVERHIPSMEDRLKREARSRHFNEAYRRLLEEKQKEDTEYKPKNLNLFFAAEKIIRKEDQRRHEIIEEIRPILRNLKNKDIII